MDQLHRRGFPALDGAFRLLRAEVEGEPQTMLSDHHRHIALLFVRFIGGVDQLYAIALVERPRLVVIDVGEEGDGSPGRPAAVRRPACGCHAAGR